MENPFATAEMAAGYARSRPAVHARVIDMACTAPGGVGRCDYALDVGCGSGLSSRPLLGIARRVIGVEPAVAMLAFARDLVSAAQFLAARAELLPLRTGSIDLIAAAGSLNYVDLDRFFAEARRVLAPGGALLVYDFGSGRSFPDSPALDRWFDRFVERYPWPALEAHELNPALLAALDSALRVTHSAEFEIPLSLAPDFYLEYMLTETNVASAMRRGAPLSEIREWCAATLGPVFAGERRDVLFRGYFVWMRGA